MCKDFHAPEFWGDSVDGTGGGEGPEAADRQHFLASVFGPAADALLDPCLLIEADLGLDHSFWPQIRVTQKSALILESLVAGLL